MEFAKKVVIVTGAGSGIGRATAREFAARKAAGIAVVDRNAEAGRKTVRDILQCGFAAEFFETDVSQCTDVVRLVDEIIKKFGGIDILINNAGIQKYGSVTSVSEEDWDEVINVNLKSVFLMSKYAIPHMVERGGGTIVNTASVMSMGAQVNCAPYIASKHAILGLVRSMALDYAKYNIRVNCVCPGAIDTPLLRWAASLDKDPEQVIRTCEKMHALGRCGTAEEVANAIVFLASDSSSFITGAALLVDGGMMVPVGGMSSQESGVGLVHHRS